MKTDYFQLTGTVVHSSVVRKDLMGTLRMLLSDRPMERLLHLLPAFGRHQRFPSLIGIALKVRQMRLHPRPRPPSTAHHPPPTAALVPTHAAARASARHVVRAGANNGARLSP